MKTPLAHLCFLVSILLSAYTGFAAEPKQEDPEIDEEMVSLNKPGRMAMREFARQEALLGTADLTQLFRAFHVDGKDPDVLAVLEELHQTEKELKNIQGEINERSANVENTVSAGSDSVGAAAFSQMGRMRELRLTSELLKVKLERLKEASDKKHDETDHEFYRKVLPIKNALKEMLVDYKIPGDRKEQERRFRNLPWDIGKSAQAMQQAAELGDKDRVILELSEMLKYSIEYHAIIARMLYPEELPAEKILKILPKMIRKSEASASVLISSILAAIGSSIAAFQITEHAFGQGGFFGATATALSGGIVIAAFFGLKIKKSRESRIVMKDILNEFNSKDPHSQIERLFRESGKARAAAISELLSKAGGPVALAYLFYREAALKHGIQTDAECVFAATGALSHQSSADGT